MEMIGKNGEVTEHTIHLDITIRKGEFKEVSEIYKLPINPTDIYLQVIAKQLLSHYGFINIESCRVDKI